ncbi:polyphosphate kinase 2 family protein [Algoriphagus litoralis]|uniref:polyphosphate kinase 2 family protein n=1 Tax=Algoriphagus litoralis TaxID=2202829 RepID=UPI000DBAB807|nr:polyphosphate kinase 2 family protein [Algoriphagus litoralis]
MLKNGEEVLSDLKRLNKEQLIARAKKFAKKYNVGNGEKFKLKNFSTTPKMVLGPEDKPLVKEALEQGIDALAALQDILYAQDRWSLLVIFQAMDAAGKDGAVKHVMSGINPQGCQVTSFKVPSAEDLDHDFLWRCQKHLPERGRIGIFNRSYYEEVLVVRVHEAILQNQKLPKKLITKKIWKERFEDIRNFEQYLQRNGTVVIKIFLHVSKEEQKQRFIDRIDDPEKNWKFSTGDIKERGYWNEYQEAYEDMIKNTSTKNSPWYIIPADNKAYARIGVAAAIISALDRMDLAYPEVSPEKVAELQEIKKALLEEKA